MVARNTCRRGDRKRLLWSFLASVILNIVIWMTLSTHPSFLRHAVPEQQREAALERSQLIRIERRIVPQPRRPLRRIASVSTQVPSLSPPQPAALSLPRNWAKQDFGNKSATETTVWLDWTKQTADFVPRVFLWQMKAPVAYMRRPSLQDAVQEVLRSLSAEGADLHASKAERVCNGERLGWFLSYVKRKDDPPAHFDETFFMAGETIYRATYIRLAAQPEDTKTREALDTLCS